MTDDMQSELLDVEYRQILFMIKPLINHINDHSHLERYRIWLERLSSVHPSEKLERNKYLLELANQIRDSTLREPFTIDPPNGPLPNIRVFLAKPRGRSANQISEFFFYGNEAEWPYLTPRPPSTLSTNVRTVASSKDRIPSDKNVKVVSSPFQTLRQTDRSQKSQSETTSWCDLTDESDLEDKICLSKQHKEEGLKIKQQYANKNPDVDLLASPGAEMAKAYLAKKEDRTKIKEVSKKKEIKKQEVCKKKEDTKKKENKKMDVKKAAVKKIEKKIKLFNIEDDPNIRTRQPTKEEIDALRMRMQDLLDLKNALKETHCITEDRKKTVETLQEQIAVMEQENKELKKRVELLDKKRKEGIDELEAENNELQALLDDQQKKYLEMDQAKTLELNSFKEKFSTLRQREIDYLKQFQKKEINSLEAKHAGKLLELQQKMKNLQKQYETRVRTLTESNSIILQQKDTQIERLRSQLKFKSGDEGGEHVADLKRCISQLEKLVHKNDTENSKKLEKMKQELEVKEMISQVQMQAQKADVILRNSATKQDEVVSAINSLEDKYRKLIESAQEHAKEAKKQDERKIHELKNLLIQHNIAF